MMGKISGTIVVVVLTILSTDEGPGSVAYIKSRKAGPAFLKLVVGGRRYYYYYYH